MKWIDPKVKKPELGAKVLVKLKNEDRIDYQVCIFAKHKKDKRVRGFFENQSYRLSYDNVMTGNVWMYNNVVAWKEIEE